MENEIGAMENRMKSDARARFDEIVAKMNARYFDRTGKSMTLWEWVWKFSDMDYCVIKRTYLRHARKWVSTVWLGLNYQFSDGPPKIFETMVFQWGSHQAMDCERTSTEQDARLAHELLCQYWRKNRRQRRKLGLRRPTLS